MYSNSGNVAGVGGASQQAPHSMVILHVYDLQPDPEAHQQRTQQPLSTTDRALLMLSGVLPTIGMGVYHTSLEVMGVKYTFAGGPGVIVSRSNGPEAGVPTGARFKEKIALGPTFRSRQELLNIVKTLSTLFFTSNSYDIIHRNCNHFTETLATALILTTAPPHDKARLISYPTWLNRLANTGAMVGVSIPTNVSNANGKAIPCNVLQEATVAAGF